jgi:integrase
MIVKPYPKDNEARTFGVREQWLDAIAGHISSRGLGRDELLFATEAGTPISRNTFRMCVWLPAVKASGLDFNVRMHDLRHAHASWLLAGGADLKGVMERMGHAQIRRLRSIFIRCRTATRRTSTPSPAWQIDAREPPALAELRLASFSAGGGGRSGHRTKRRDVLAQV